MTLALGVDIGGTGIKAAIVDIESGELVSDRLKVATSIILRNNFRCPYCNEPTVLEIRQRRVQ